MRVQVSPGVYRDEGPRIPYFNPRPAGTPIAAVAERKHKNHVYRGDRCTFCGTLRAGA